MLIQETHHDVPTQAGGDMSKLHPIDICLSDTRETLMQLLGIFLFHPTIAGYPKAKFPGVVVFSEIYQGREGWLKDIPLLWTFEQA